MRSSPPSPPGASDGVATGGQPRTTSTSPPPAAEFGGSRTYRGPVAAHKDEKLPIKMLNDRLLVKLTAEGERQSSGGILIPATAEMKKRLVWAEVVASGPNVRTMEAGDHVLFSPEDRYEVEVRGDDYIILRERDIHAVAAERLEESSTGLYL